MVETSGRRTARRYFGRVSAASVTTLTYYPVKGLAGVSVERTDVLATGLRHDRSFMLVEVEGADMSFQVISRTGATVDSGVIHRGPVA